LAVVDPSRQSSASLGQVARHLGLLFIVIVFLAPLIWMLSTSIKPESQAASGEIRLLPDPASSSLHQARENYSRVWNDRSVRFPLYLRNTLIVAGLGVIGMTLSSAVVAYGLSRIQWRGRGLVFFLVLATMMIPFPVLMVPLYIIFRDLGWTGSLKPLWVPAWFGSAFNIFLLRQFFSTIPTQLDEAARIDGCSHWTIFWKIILPLSRPALAVVALFHFIYVWNDFVGPLIFLTDRDQFTLALGLQLYQSQAGNTPWNLLMAASTLMISPLVLLFFLAQRTFVQGVSTEGIK
jgi:multiple sugar transport system permease protein